MIPKDVKSVLDIGSLGNIFRNNYDVITLDAEGKPNIKQDLNKNQKLDLKNNSFDIVILNQILEHLPTCEEIIKESKRVSKKYIFVGLPNELTWGSRIKFLFGFIDGEGYLPYWHKHRFSIKTIEDFVFEFFGNYEYKRYFGAFTGAGLLPVKIRDFLARKIPTLFAKEVFYLIKK